MSYAIIAYTYAQVFNLYTRQADKGLHEHDHFVRDHEHEFPIDAFDKLILTEQEEEVVIRKYSNIEQEIKPRDDCAIGVGYTTCVDINFKAVDLFKAMNNEFNRLKKDGPILP